MPKSLAELRSSDKVGLPERVYPLCLAGKLSADIEVLEAELDLIEDRPATNGRVGAKSPRKKLEQQIESIRDEMNDHLAEIRFRAKPGHEWRTFVNAHPPSDDAIDQRSGVSLDGFIKDMDEFVVDVNGDDLGPGDWEWIVSTAADGDLKACAGLLIDMHNRAVSIPKSRLTSPTSREPSTD